MREQYPLRKIVQAYEMLQSGEAKKQAKRANNLLASMEKEGDKQHFARALTEPFLGHTFFVRPVVVNAPSGHMLLPLQAEEGAAPFIPSDNANAVSCARRVLRKKLGLPNKLARRLITFGNPLIGVDVLPCLQKDKKHVVLSIAVLWPADTSPWYITNDRYGWKAMTDILNEVPQGHSHGVDLHRLVRTIQHRLDIAHDGFARIAPPSNRDPNLMVAAPAPATGTRIPTGAHGVI